jgi:endonuclease/exonuclease/phosphatase (EEP) superfamily protein YafD
VYDGNRDPAGAARAVLATGADVLVIPEYTRNFATAFTTNPASAAYAYQWTKGNSGRVAIFSKLPFASTATPQIGGFYATTVEVDVAGRHLRVVGVHTQSPRSGDRPRWTRDLAALRALARQHLDEPLVLAGDFNATRWNPPFGDFLSLGLTDAHEDRGKGFTTSWPDHGRAYGFFGPVLRLDHALVDRGVAVLAVHDFEIPGSDHRGFVTELAVGTNGQGG